MQTKIQAIESIKKQNDEELTVIAVFKGSEWRACGFKTVREAQYWLLFNKDYMYAGTGDIIKI